MLCKSIIIIISFVEFKIFSNFANFCYWRIMYWNSAFFQLCFYYAAHPFDQRLTVREEEEGGSWMREKTLQCHHGVFSQDKIKEYESLVINTHSKILKTQLEEAIMLDSAQSRGILRVKKKYFSIQSLKNGDPRQSLE